MLTGCLLEARAYFVQDIFHNWPTSVAKLILRHIKVAMKPGYSKLLISELVLPDKSCPLSMAGLDFGMMYLHSGLERSEQQWRDLLASQGLRVLHVHHEPGGDGAVIEAVVDEQPEIMIEDEFNGETTVSAIAEMYAL